MERQTICLDGKWKIAFDPKNEGKREGWFNKGLKGRRGTIEVKVPGIWNEIRPDYQGVAWYERNFFLPSRYRSKTLQLRFDAVDYYTEVWLNGKYIGSHEGGYTPFSFDISDCVRFGSKNENRLTLRVLAPPLGKHLERFALEETPCAKESCYYDFAGIWQSVKIEVLNNVWCKACFIEPRVNRKDIVIRSELKNEESIEENVEVCFMVTAKSLPKEVVARKSQRLTLSPGLNKVNITVGLNEPVLWTPENPHLYLLTVIVSKSGQVLDELTTAFGMREFTVKDNKFYLNGERIFIKAALLQPDYPMTIAYPLDQGLAKRELQLAKEAGFNMVRLHIKTAPEITLRLADELGIMLYEEPPIGWIKDSPYMEERCKNEVRGMVLRDRNHPSVVMWGILNESGNWQFGEEGAQRIKNKLCQVARELDPTRIIIDDSGGTNNTKDWGHYILPYQRKQVEYQDLHLYQRAPVDEDIMNYYKKIGESRSLLFISEFGIGGMEDLPRVLRAYGGKRKLKDYRMLRNILTSMEHGFRKRGLDKIFGTFSDFCLAAQELQAIGVKLQVEAMRMNRGAAGYCLTQLNDAGFELGAGILDRWRNPKKVFHALKLVQRAVHVSIHIEPQNPWSGDRLNISLAVVNEARLAGTFVLALRVLGPGKKVVFQKDVSIDLRGRLSRVKRISFPITGAAGRYTVVARLRSGRRIIAENTYKFLVMKRKKHNYKEVEEIVVLDPKGVVKGFLENRKIKCIDFNEEIDHSKLIVVPKIANTIWAYPLEELLRVLDLARRGCIVLFLGLPEDASEVLSSVDDLFSKLRSKDSVGGFLGIFHYVKAHPIFEGLPVNQLMGQDYCNICPPLSFVGLEGETVVGSFDTNAVGTKAFMLQGGQDWWGSDLIIVPYGKGKIIFSHLRIVENLGKDAVADRIFSNMVEFGSWGTGRLISDAQTSERRKIENQLGRLEALREVMLRKWWVIGPFANNRDAGLDNKYPPEEGIQLEKRYKGWYQEVRWKEWFTKKTENHLLDFQKVLSPIYCFYPRFDSGIAYAHTLVYSSYNRKAQLQVGSEDGVKVWLNDDLVLNNHVHRKAAPGQDSVPIVLRKGQNKILVKVEKIPGNWKLYLEIVDAKGAPCVGFLGSGEKSY